MVANEVYHMPTAKFFAIALFMNKSFLSHHLLNENGEGQVELIKDEKLNKMLLKFVHLCSPSIRNLIASLNIV